MSFNPLFITDSPFRLCENRNCDHILEDHSGGICKKCNCLDFKKNELIIYLKYDGINHSCNNFLERKCPNCGNPTHMAMVGIEGADPINTIKLDNSEHGLTIETALHNCSKCGLISYYDIGISFSGILHDLTFKAELKKREAQNKNNLSS